MQAHLFNRHLFYTVTVGWIITPISFGHHALSTISCRFGSLHLTPHEHISLSICPYSRFWTLCLVSCHHPAQVAFVFVWVPSLPGLEVIPGIRLVVFTYLPTHRQEERCEMGGYIYCGAIGFRASVFMCERL